MFFISAGACKKTMSIKNIKLYKSDSWNQCLIKINSAVIKCIFIDEIKRERSYNIEMYKSYDMVTLLCDGMIVYESKGWFGYTLEFINTHGDIYEELIVDGVIYEEIIRDI